MAQAYWRPLIEANQEVNFFEYIIMLENFLVNYSCSLKYVEKNLVNYSCFGSCPRYGIFLLHNHMLFQEHKGYQNPTQFFIHGNAERQRMLALVDMKVHCSSSLHRNKDM